MTLALCVLVGIPLLLWLVVQVARLGQRRRWKVWYPDHGTNGWQCPQCHRVWAPYVNECGACAPAVVPETLDPSRTPYAPAWRHPYRGGSVVGTDVPWWDLMPTNVSGVEP